MATEVEQISVARTLPLEHVELRAGIGGGPDVHGSAVVVLNLGCDEGQLDPVIAGDRKDRCGIYRRAERTRKGKARVICGNNHRSLSGTAARNDAQLPTHQRLGRGKHARLDTDAALCGVRDNEVGKGKPFDRQHVARIWPVEHRVGGDGAHSIEIEQCSVG